MGVTRELLGAPLQPPQNNTHINLPQNANVHIIYAYNTSSDNDH